MFSEGNRVAYFIIYDIPVDKLNFKKAKVLSSESLGQITAANGLHL